jgi:hypothetical protein
MNALRVLRHLLSDRKYMQVLQNFSPGRGVPYDKRSRSAVDLLVRKTRKEVVSARVGGPELDGAEGSMNALAESLSLIKFLERHNDPANPFHMDEHQPLCVRHQFKDGVTFMCLTTPHLQPENNMARAENCGCQKTAHVEGSFGMISICMNMGAHYNPVSVSIVNSESKRAIKTEYEATCTGLYTLYNSASL